MSRQTWRDHADANKTPQNLVRARWINLEDQLKL